MHFVIKPPIQGLRLSLQHEVKIYTHQQQIIIKTIAHYIRYLDRKPEAY